MSLHTSRKSLDKRSTDTILPPLSLDTNNIQAELIFVNDAVDSTVPGFSQMSSGLRESTTIAHRNQQIENKPFKKNGRTVHHLFEKIEVDPKVQTENMLS